MFVQGKLEKNKRRYPWAQFIIDSNGLGLKTWQLDADTSVFVLDKDGRVQWSKDGALSPKEVTQVIGLLHKLLKDGKSA